MPAKDHLAAACCLCFSYVSNRRTVQQSLPFCYFDCFSTVLLSHPPAAILDGPFEIQFFSLGICQHLSHLLHTGNARSCLEPGVTPRVLDCPGVQDGEQHGDQHTGAQAGDAAARLQQA